MFGVRGVGRQSIGDHVYAASRFQTKTSNKAVAKVVEKASKKLRAAEQHAAPRVRALAPDVRQDALATLTDLGVERLALWCQELLRIKA